MARNTSCRGGVGLGVNIVFALDNISVLLYFFQTDGHLGKG